MDLMIFYKALTCSNINDNLGLSWFIRVDKVDIGSYTPHPCHPGRPWPRHDRACGAPASGAAGSCAGASSAGANSAGATAYRGSWNGGSLRNGRGRASCLGGSGDRPFLGGKLLMENGTMVNKSLGWTCWTKSGLTKHYSKNQTHVKTIYDLQTS